MKSEVIRQKFIDFFKKHGHEIVSSSSLIPAEDPTLLFANAGMNQFKDLFLGKEKRSYTRASTIQKCVRAGGKHNDLEQVGFTKRHLTFFEMMGNFSFGDYFKKEAIQFTWDFFTQEMKLDPAKLYPTVYHDDDESFAIWHEQIGIAKERITRLGAKDNFWQMGDTGPCGPCTEIMYDRGAEHSCGESTCAPGCECPRYLELWNLVFMQFDRQEDGSDIPLEKPGVDTGMGLERICLVMQDVDNVFQTDLFMRLTDRAQKISGIDYKSAPTQTQVAFHVIGDHIRSSSLLIADGCTPSNDGRGYVLRKIIRRAALFAQKLSDERTLLPQVAEEFISFFSPVYPNLETSKVLILKLLQSEIDRFSANLIAGQQILQKYMDAHTKAQRSELSGAESFKLYDTYGFPLELTIVIAQEHGFSVDVSGFETEMAKQQAQSGKKSMQKKEQLTIDEDIHTVFVGYESYKTMSPVIFFKQEDDAAWLVTKESPFYVESGGQVSDSGVVKIGDTAYPVIELKKIGSPWSNPAIAVKIKTGKNTPTITIGDTVESVVDATKRMNAVRNHTATHLLQATLIEVLGKQVKQAGSVVHPDYLRFDYTYHEPMTAEQIARVEDIINEKIRENIPTNIFETDLKDAQSRGVISFFGEKYNPENVRVVEIPGFSAELCGGTHAPSTGIIGCFKITSESALSTGTRRIVALTGPQALRVYRQSFNTVKKLSEQFKAKPELVAAAVEKQEQQLQAALREIKQLKKQAWKSQVPTWQKQVAAVGNIPFLYLELSDIGNDELKNICQAIEQKTPGFYFVVAGSDRKNFLGYVSKDYKETVDLKKLAPLLKDIGLRGGGSSSLIQGGGSPTSSIEATVRGWITTID